jgi:hypothetical protein
MRKRFKKLGVTIGAVSVMALSLAIPAQASGGGVGEPTTAVADGRTVSSIGNYGMTRNPDGSRTVVYQCNTLATGDVASTTSNCSLQVSGSQVSGGSVTLPGPTSEFVGTTTITTSGAVRLCYSGSAQFIVNSLTLANSQMCTRANVAIP